MASNRSVNTPENKKEPKMAKKLMVVQEVSHEKSATSKRPAKPHKDGGWSPSIDKKPFMNSMEPNDLRQMK